MTKLRTFFNKEVTRFFNKEEGVTAIEYGLIAFLIAIVCIVTWTAVGNRLIAIFGQVVTTLGG